MSAVDLLPCPFCEGKAKWEKGSYADGAEWRYIACASCDAIGPNVPKNGWSKAAVIAAWNRRAPISAGKVKALEWGDGKFSGQPAWFADTAFGCLMVVDHLIHENGIQAYDVAGESIGIFPDVSAAKAAAQADFEACILAQFQPGDGWQGIESAPKDGTSVDLWHRVYGRRADHYWGNSDHCCGEAGQYCDSEWHSEPQGWIDSTFNEAASDGEDFTHWRPIPAGPASLLQNNGEG